MGGHSSENKQGLPYDLPLLKEPLNHRQREVEREYQVAELTGYENQIKGILEDIYNHVLYLKYQFSLAPWDEKAFRKNLIKNETQDSMMDKFHQAFSSHINYPHMKYHLMSIFIKKEVRGNVIKTIQNFLGEKYPEECVPLQVNPPSYYPEEYLSIPTPIR